jgi:hypothetical protein
MPAPGDGFAEIRVHGVGEQEYLSSITSARVTRLNPWAEAVDPPLLPRHRLSLINWSRSNRRRTGFLWYLAFPFTLANVAGRMVERTGHSTPASSGVLLQLGSLLLTLSQLAWLVVLGETVLEHLAGPLGLSGSADGAARGIPVAGATALALFIAYRWLRVIRVQREAPRRGRPVAFLHAGALLGAGTLLALALPAETASRAWPSTAGPDAVHRLDAMALWIVVSLGALILLTAAPALRRPAGAGATRRFAAPEAAAFGLLLLALFLMHSVNALVRMLLDGLLGYVVRLFGGQEHGARTVRVLLAWDDPLDAGDSRLDLFPLLALTALVGLALTAAGALLLDRRLGLGPLVGAPEPRLRWWHRVVAAAPALLPRVLPAGTALGAAGMGAAMVLGEGRLGGPWLALAVLLLQLAGAAVVLTLLLGQLRPVQEVLGRAADAAGFWPVRDHPLAGASYREAVIAGIEQEAARLGPSRVALVGYSQGSVICAWLVAETRALEGCRELHLVTTGSPLVSLYAAFFPAYFTPGWFGRVADRSTGWANFWRATDPVATAVPGAANVELTDPDSTGTVHGHGGYWNAPEVIKHVAAVAAGGRDSPYQHPAGRIDPT